MIVGAKTRRCRQSTRQFHFRCVSKALWIGLVQTCIQKKSERGKNCVGKKRLKFYMSRKFSKNLQVFFSTFLRPRRDNVSEDSAKVQRLKNKLQTRLTHILKLIFNNFKMWRQRASRPIRRVLGRLNQNHLNLHQTTFEWSNCRNHEVDDFLCPAFFYIVFYVLELLRLIQGTPRPFE